MTQQQIQAKLQKQIKTYLAEPCNKVCFTCSQKGPGYLLCDFNVYVCTKCSGLCWRVKGISMSNFTEKEVSELGAAGNGVAREHYLANFNFEKVSMPEPGDEAAILKFMTSVFVKQTFAKGNEPRSKGGKQIQQKPQPAQKPQTDDDDDDWDPFTPSKGSQPQRQQPAPQQHSQPAPQQHVPQQPQQLRPSNQPAQNPPQQQQHQPAPVQQQPAQPAKTSDLLLGLNFAPVQPQPQPQPLQPAQPLQAPMQYQAFTLDQQRLMQQQILAQQQLLAQQQQYLAQMGQVSLQPGYPMQFQPQLYQQPGQQFGPGGVLQPQQHHLQQQQAVPTLSPEQQALKQKQQQAQDAQFAGLFSNLLNDKDFGNQ